MRSPCRFVSCPVSGGNIKKVKTRLVDNIWAFHHLKKSKIVSSTADPSSTLAYSVGWFCRRYFPKRHKSSSSNSSNLFRFSQDPTCSTQPRESRSTHLCQLLV